MKTEQTQWTQGSGWEPTAPGGLGAAAQLVMLFGSTSVLKEQQLQRQVQQLRIEIDQERRAREVADITESDYFQQLLGKADELRNRIKDNE